MALFKGQSGRGRVVTLLKNAKDYPVVYYSLWISDRRVQRRDSSYGGAIPKGHADSTAGRSSPAQGAHQLCLPWVATCSCKKETPFISVSTPQQDAPVCAAVHAGMHSAEGGRNNKQVQPGGSKHRVFEANDSVPAFMASG